MGTLSGSSTHSLILSRSLVPRHIMVTGSLHAAQLARERGRGRAITAAEEGDRHTDRDRDRDRAARRSCSEHSVRMAERSKAPDSRHSALARPRRVRAFWSSSEGVGSNPTPDIPPFVLSFDREAPYSAQLGWGPGGRVGDPTKSGSAALASQLAPSRWRGRRVEPAAPMAERATSVVVGCVRRPRPRREGRGPRPVPSRPAASAARVLTRRCHTERGLVSRPTPGDGTGLRDAKGLGPSERCSPPRCPTKREVDTTPGGTRTLNPRFRRPMPYPLGHRG